MKNIEIRKSLENKSVVNNIKFRNGNLAYDIHGVKLSPKQNLPLFINKESYKKYDDMMMAELRAIRGF